MKITKPYLISLIKEALEDELEMTDNTKPTFNQQMDEILNATKDMAWVNKLEASMNDPKTKEYADKDAIKHLRNAMKALKTAQNVIKDLRRSPGGK